MVGGTSIIYYLLKIFQRSLNICSYEYSDDKFSSIETIKKIAKKLIYLKEEKIIKTRN